MFSIRSSMRRTLSRVAIAGVLVSLTGCAATVTTRGQARFVYDDPVVYVDVVPARVYDYPRVSYHGRPAYLVNGRWYYETHEGWVYFEREPVELRHYRTARAVPERGYRPRRHYYTNPQEGPRRRYYD